MDKAKTIDIQSWMKTPQTKKVMNTLGDGNAMFVGGCVRNALLGFDVTDIDIATKHHPETVIELLEAQNIKAIPTGIDHGTITAVCDDKTFEITTLRKDVQTDGRRAVIEFAEKWEDDAMRRDFTMNTLLMNPNGDVFDPTGEGVNDLEARAVRFVGDAEQRIQEEILGILRFFRFHATYGENDPDNNALKACAKHADKIKELSKERITQEFMKILSLDNPVNILRIMFDNNVLQEFDFGAENLETLKHLCTFQNNYALAFVASRLFALGGLSIANVESMESLLLLPKVFKKDMQAIDAVLKLPDLKDDHAVKVAIYKYGRVATAQSLMIEIATDRVINGYGPKAVKIIQNWDVPTFPINGDDLIKEGIRKGPEIGEELSKREEEWIQNGFKFN